MLDEVDLVALDRDDHRPFFVVELELHRVGVRLLAPVGVVADELRADLWRVAVELERPGAVERLPPVRRIEVGRDDDRVVVGRADERGEVAVRRVEMEDDGCVVGCLGVPGERTPPSAESALDAFFGSTSVSNVVLTSFAVIVAPLWKVTPWRILNVHSVPSALGDQLSASVGYELELRVGKRKKFAGRAEQPGSALVFDDDGIRLGRGLNDRHADVAAGLDGARGRRRGAATRCLSAACRLRTLPRETRPAGWTCRRRCRGARTPAA